MGREVEVFAEGMESEDDAGDALRAVQGGAQVVSEGLLRQSTEVFEEVAVALEIGAEHFGNGQDVMAVGHGARTWSRMKRAVVWTFFWWQEGQNQRLLQEKAKRYSCSQWSQRIRANPRWRLPQSRNLWTTSGMTGRRRPRRGWYCTG
jgi:hypothetical protein